MKRTLLLVLGLLLVGSTGVDRNINLAPANDADAAFTSELYSQVGTWHVGAEFMDDGTRKKKGSYQRYGKRTASEDGKDCRKKLPDKFF